MGDRFRPGGRNNAYEDDFDSRYGGNYDRRDYYDRYEHPPPPPPDRYDGRYRDRFDGRYEDERRDGGYTFRGAAERENYRVRHAEDDFTFRAQGPAAPRFPPPDRYAPPPPPQSRPRRIENGRFDQGKRGPPGHQHARAYDARSGGRFKKPRPHQRDILQRARRGSTPDQLPGMNADGQARFKAVDSSSDEGEVVDLTNDSDDDDSIYNRARKRVKPDTSQPADAEAPKWSNPEYLTALPPPETLGAPKKDIVQVIRKAKLESAQNADSLSNAVKDNIDFISLSFDDEDERMSENDAPSNAPTGPAEHGRRGEMRPNDTHVQNGRAPEFEAPAPSFKPINLGSAKDTVGPPPPPPADFVMPSDEELISMNGGYNKGKKRKYQDVSTEIGAIVPQWRMSGSDSTPWCTVDPTNTASTGLESLHDEIVDFYEFVRPHDYEEAVRHDLIDRVRRAVRSAPNKVGGAAKVEIRSFGSFASGLYLPTADMDLVAVSPSYLSHGVKSFCQTKSRVFTLSHHLTHVGIAVPGTVSPVVGAKVPIIKFTDSKTGIKVDISFENDSGLVANDTFLEWKAQYPAMPVLVVLIKQMLAMRDLNEVFTGGLGGFSIICLVVSMLQLNPDLNAHDVNPEEYYGELLLSFLDLYGNKFNIKSTGIVMNPPAYYDKARNPGYKQNDNTLTIVDPNNPLNDISGGSRNVETVFAVFRSAFSKIQSRLAQFRAGEDDEESILGCVLGGNYSSFMHQRNKLSLLHRGKAVSPPPAPMPNPQTKGPKRKRQKQTQPSANEQNNSFPRTQQPSKPASAPQKPPRPPPTRQQPPPPKAAAQSGKMKPIDVAAQRYMQHPLPPRPADDRAKNQRSNKPGYVDAFIAADAEMSE